MSKTNIERYEWDFDSCPEDQLELCFEYERARSSAGQIEVKEAEEWRRQGIKWASDEDRLARRHSGRVVEPLFFDQVEGATFDDYWKQIAEDNLPLFAMSLYPEFPCTPYLKILEPERSRRFALIKAAGVYPVCAADEGLSKAFREKHGDDDRSWFEEEVYSLNREFDLSEGNKGVSHKGFSYEIDGNAIKSVNPGPTWAVFRFDWHLEDAVFIDALKAWLDKKRDRTVKIHYRRGAASDPRQFEARLNQLGAWRLLNFPMTWKEAADHTQAVRDSHESLYSEQPAWITARNKANAFLGRASLKESF